MKVGEIDENDEVQIKEITLKDSLPFLHLQQLEQNILVCSGFDQQPCLLRLRSDSGYDLRKLTGHHKKKLIKRKSLVD